MALTQRLEFRQSQSLVMTPQLMQAIKLLQLSNLDLSAFVEEELERNPLLERASDGPEAAGGGRAGAGAGRIFRFRRFRRRLWRRRRRRAFRNGRRLRRRQFRAGPGRMDESRSRQPHRDRADPGYRPRQRLLRGAGRGRRAHRAGRGADRLHRMGRRRLQRRGLQSRSLRRRRDHARQPSRRAAGGGLHRARAAHDRPVPDRPRRRGRLSAAGSRPGRRAAGRVASGRRGGSCRAAEIRSARRLRANP